MPIPFSRFACIALRTPMPGLSQAEFPREMVNIHSKERTNDVASYHIFELSSPPRGGQDAFFFKSFLSTPNIEERYRSLTLCQGVVSILTEPPSSPVTSL